ncbi:MAG TPA: hypothetical protein VFJ47_06460 [Terriglobales bacterium]|nr:hypothetical protein [Terriglobales bacterium]
MSDDRQAYTPGDAVYTKTGKRRAAMRQSNSRTESRLGGLLFGGGLIWAAYAARADYSALWQPGLHTPGPLEVCAIGILMWLHAKWRRSIQPK